MIELIIVIGIIVLIALYFLFAKKYPKLKGILIGAAGALAGVALLMSKSLSVFSKKAIEDIGKSKANDEKRTKIVKKTEDQIKKNKELIDEIQKLLSSDNN